MADTPLLVMTGIQKRFPGVVALDSVDFSCKDGEIHGLIGENGAGKSTLIKVLSGVYRPDVGEIRIAGRPARIASPSQGASLGISVIHQELNLIDDLTLAQNIFLGHEPRRALGLVDFPTMYSSARRFLEIVGLGHVDPRVKVRGLNLEQKQLVEVAKALSIDARILVMDEPTAALNAEEVERLLKLMRDLAQRGCGVIFISHRMEEVFAVSDTITVLRDGKVVATRARSDIDPETAVKMMTGKARVGARVTGKPPSDRRVLEVKDLTVPGSFYDVSFSVHEGEIVGMVGLEGQGQRELLRTVFGDLRPSRGTVRVRGAERRLLSPRDAIKAGIAFVPEERKIEGLCLSLDIRQNIALATLDRRQSAGFVRLAREAEEAKGLVERLRIHLVSLMQEAGSLSGGNQQKVVMAKWLCGHPSVLLFSEPTRGIDVGAKEEIYGLIRQQADRGSGVLIVSGELMEVLRLCDRILVVREGRIVKEIRAEDADRETIMAAEWGLDGNSVPGAASNAFPRRADKALRTTGRPSVSRDPSLPIYVITMVVLILAGAYSPTFRRLYNLSNVAVQTIALGLAALGQIFAILVGDVDLCVGGVISLTTVIGATLMSQPWVGVAGVAGMSLALGAAVGMVNGWLASRLRMDAMVITFATNSVLMGLALHLMPVPGGVVPYSFMRLVGLTLLGIPAPVFMLLALAVFSNYVLNRTVLGVHVRAVGGDRGAAFRSGIGVTATKIWAHVIACMFAAVAGLFLAARMGSGDALAGSAFSLDSMTAVIAGGTNFASGMGDVAGTVTAAFLITLLGNVFNHLGVSTYLQYVFKGVLLLIAVAGGAIRRKTQLRSGR